MSIITTFETKVRPSGGFSIPAKIVYQLSLEDGMHIPAVIYTPTEVVLHSLRLSSGCEVQYSKDNRPLEDQLTPNTPLTVTLVLR